MLLKLSVRSAGCVFQMSERRGRTRDCRKQSWCGASIVKQTMVAGAEMTWWRSLHFQAIRD